MDICSERPHEDHSVSGICGPARDCARTAYYGLARAEEMYRQVMERLSAGL